MTVALLAAPGPGWAMDSELLVSAIARLSRTATEDFAVPEMLRALSEAATSALPGDGAGVMIRENGRNVFVHATGSGSVDVSSLERLQEALQSGPCADCIAQSSTVTSQDMARDGRWVEFQELAAEVGLGAVVAIPLLSRGRGWGSLDLYRRQPGAWTAAELQAAQALADAAVSYLVMAHDRDQARAAQRALSHRAMHDDLTGLPNRALMFDRLDHALANAARWSTAVAVVFLDLDMFKGINDTFGHTTADDVLVEVANRLAVTVRGGDTLARFAGDEFVVVCEGLPHDSSEALGERVAALTGRLQRALHAPIRVGQVDVVVSASIGVAISRDPMTGAELVADADTAMYAAKQSGRGRVNVRDHVTLSAIGYAHQLERDLAGALQRGELRVYYQPIVHAGTREVAAVEALLRWNQHDLGVLPAATFIDIAVRSGLIVTIGRWVILQACQQMAAWQRNLPHTAPATVYVNLSARELADDGLPDSIATALADSGLDPRHLGIEIVEEDLADSPALERLQDLHRRGHPLSIDDFGTGYSSLSRLLDLPVDVAKIDKSVIAGIPSHHRRIRFVDGVLQMANTLDLQVIAEGVENSDQADHLTRIGCQLLQGHHLARPQPADQLTATWTS